jgi:hypothetical protein
MAIEQIPQRLAVPSVERGDLLLGGCAVFDPGDVRENRFPDQDDELFAPGNQPQRNPEPVGPGDERDLKPGGDSGGEAVPKKSEP